MKRVLSVILIFVMIFSFTACGKKEESSKEVKDIFGITKKMNGEKETVSTVDPDCEHTYDAGTVTVEPTCDKTGKMIYTCTKCGDKKTEQLPARAHSFGDWTVSSSATCDKTGTKTRKCSECGELETATIAKTAHHYSNGVCTICGAEDKTEYKVTTYEELTNALENGVANIHISGDITCGDDYFTFYGIKEVIIDEGATFTANYLSICGDSGDIVVKNYGTIKADAISIIDGSTHKSFFGTPIYDDTAHNTTLINYGSIKLDNAAEDSFFMRGPKTEFIQESSGYFRNYSYVELQYGAVLTINSVWLDSPKTAPGFYTDKGITTLDLLFEDYGYDDEVCHVIGLYSQKAKIVKKVQQTWDQFIGN